MTTHRNQTRSSEDRAANTREAGDREMFTDLVCRLRHELLDTSTVAFTPSEAAQLWGLDRATSACLLEFLAIRGFVQKTSEGTYARAMG